MTFRYADEGGNELTVEPSIIRESCRVIARDPDLDETACVVIPRENVPDAAAGIVAAMHCSVDLQPPIILAPPSAAEGSVIASAPGISVHRSYDLSRPVTIGIRGVTEQLTPDAARKVAARIAFSADQADSDPDLAMTAELAELICVYGGAEQGRRSARAILSRYELSERDA